MDQGVQTRVAIAVVTVALLLGAALAWHLSIGPASYRELDAVRTGLRQIPGVELLELDYVKEITVEHISARIKVADKGELALMNLDRDSFRTPESIQLHSIGPYRLCFQGEGYVGAYEAATGKPVRSEFYGGAPDISPTGEFARLFPFKLTNVEAVVTHYDDILQIVGSWPREANRAHFRDEAGTVFSYYVETDDVPGDPEPKPN